MKLSINNFDGKLWKCKKCRKKYIKNRSEIIKQKCLDYKGCNKCSKCGYDKYVGAIDFHHINTKTFEINSIGSLDFCDIHKKELDKCETICSNCHRKRHKQLY